jgi:phosphate acyltransferase
MTLGKRHTVVLDVMGADRGPREMILGGLEAAHRLGDRLDVVLVGRQTIIDQVLGDIKDKPTNIRTRHAEAEVSMDMPATDGVKLRDSSISVGLQMVKQGEADAFVSPGNTGAVMATALLTLGRMQGVARPAIASLFPTSEGRPCVVLDVGANASCKPLHLAQFAMMGSVYSNVIFANESPRVGLISIGEERSKGNELIFQSTKLLAESHINFVGNIEGRDILSGAVNVAVTDGFTGNILLKLAESVQPFLVKAVKRQIQTNIFSRFGVMLMAPFLKRLMRTFDYAASGGAPLLGVNGVVIICHGSSSAKAISNGIAVADEMVSGGVNERIRNELTTNHLGKPDDATAKSQDFGNGVICSAPSDDQR